MVYGIYNVMHFKWLKKVLNKKITSLYLLARRKDCGRIFVYKFQRFTVLIDIEPKKLGENLRSNL